MIFGERDLRCLVRQFLEHHLTERTDAGAGQTAEAEACSIAGRSCKDRGRPCQDRTRAACVKVPLREPTTRHARTAGSVSEPEMRVPAVELATVPGLAPVVG